MGVPFQVKMPVNYNNVTIEEIEEIIEEEYEEQKVSPEKILEKAIEEADLIVKEAKLEAERLFLIKVQEIERIELDTIKNADRGVYTFGPGSPSPSRRASPADPWPGAPRVWR
jgi:hypothetical protein